MENKILTTILNGTYSCLRALATSARRSEHLGAPPQQAASDLTRAGWRTGVESSALRARVPPRVQVDARYIVAQNSRIPEILPSKF